MTCDDARRLILLDGPGERSEGDTRSLQQHLLECPACTTFADQMAAAGESLRGVASRLNSSIHIPPAPVIAFHTGNRWIEAFFALTERRMVRYSYAVVVAAIAVVMIGQITEPASGVHIKDTMPVAVVYHLNDTGDPAFRQVMSDPRIQERITAGAGVVVRKAEIDRILTLAGQQLVHTAGIRIQDQRMLEVALDRIRSSVTVSIRPNA